MKTSQTLTTSILLMILVTLLYSCKMYDKQPVLLLKDAIANVDGVFKWDSEQQRWNFSNKLHIENILSKYEKEVAVQELVSCLDDMTKTKSQLKNGDSATLAAVCQVGLSITAYYEEVNENGDIVSFAPALTPVRSKAEWLDVKAEWEKVINLKIVKFY